MSTYSRSVISRPEKRGYRCKTWGATFGFTDNDLLRYCSTHFKTTPAGDGVLRYPYGTQTDIMRYADGSFDYKWALFGRLPATLVNTNGLWKFAMAFLVAPVPKN